MNVVSFFAGCGGLDLGFEQAGFHVVWANELEPTVYDTYVKNHPNSKLVLGDICNIDPVDVPDCDGFIGGPPCQSWSVAGRQKGLDDERGQLFLKYIELIDTKKPKFFLIENVKGLLDEKFRDVFDDFLKRLDSAGYDVKWQLLDAVNYKIPQNRERVFLIGFRKDLHINYLFPAPTCSEPISLKSAIGDITEEPERYLDKDIVHPNAIRKNHDVIATKFGSFYYRGNRRRGWQQPSFTIHATAGNTPLHPSSLKMLFFGHENWNFQKDKLDAYRRLSVRECARIQTFPDDFVFYGNDIIAQYKMIGNAVPPRLGKVLAKSILDALNDGLMKNSAPQIEQEKNEASTVLVGYYKNKHHHNLIVQNKLYYVRSDGRCGSMFKEDCDTIPKYVLLHHKDSAEFYELEMEEPLLVEEFYLKTLGFETSGQTYLCFRLKSQRAVSSTEISGKECKPSYDPCNYSPYFITLKEVLGE